jgi:hypothetical protein
MPTWAAEKAGLAPGKRRFDCAVGVRDAAHHDERVNHALTQERVNLRAAAPPRGAAIDSTRKRFTSDEKLAHDLR